jgi:LmbE family N-acetylglucosaminyl deacetylase
VTCIVFVHAHPDDEALLTGGTMAQLSSRGHRVVLVTATDGAAGLTSATGTSPTAVAATRTAELHAAARALRCARVACLGYPDSGSAGPVLAGSFAALPVGDTAARLAAVLREERADMVVGYDAVGGYGHRDHRQVHRATRAAAALAGTPRVLEATVDRRALQRALRVASPLTRGAADFRPQRFADRYSDPADITHVIDVRPHLAAKRAAMQAHASQRDGGDEQRSLERFLRLPAPVFALVFGREWFVEVGAATRPRRRRDLLERA